jgi:endonuclease YncB( thermonuclease family)
MQFFKFVCVAAIMLSASHAAYSSMTVQGIPRVIDGDTLQVGKTRVRMLGIDAPEKRQRCLKHSQPYNCGLDAKEQLAALVQNKVVVCNVSGYDRYKRSVAECFLSKVNLNSWMVENGWALAYRQYSDKYILEEGSAKAAKKGIWASDFVAPWDYRHKRDIR